MLVFSYDTIVRPSWIFVLPLLAGGAEAVNASKVGISAAGDGGGGGRKGRGSSVS